MAERNWGLIRSGATFEALAATLVYFEDAKATLYGRPGKDGGQDVRSGSGTIVYQAKFHKDESSAAAIKDALKAAKDLKKILSDAKHPRHRQWQGVTEWVLMTNAQFNPTDDQRWKDEVAPEFTKIGLAASYQGQRDLDVRLDKQPEVHRAYFEGKARSMLALPEAWSVVEHEAMFLPRAIHADLRGREDAMQKVAAFLGSSATYLVVTGPGGVGKTRFLLEAGTTVAAPAGWQVLRANLARISGGGDWYDAIVPERRTLLLVDEPQDEQELRQIVEEMTNTLGRANQWKVALAVRSPNDPVRHFLTSPRMTRHTQELELKALKATDAADFTLELIESGALSAQPADWKRDAATRLAKLYDSFPVWLSLAVELLEHHGDVTKVPETAEGLAHEYLEEVYSQQHDFSPDTLKRTLRAIALVRTLNTEEPLTMALAEQLSGHPDRTALLSCIQRLIERKVLNKRGAFDRLVEIKPDVLRDQILRSWLLLRVEFGEQRWRATDEAQGLIRRVLDGITSGRIDQLTRAVLRAMSRTEILLKLAGQDAPLLDGLFGGLDSALSSLKASARLVIAELMLDVAQARPIAVAELSMRIRTNPCEAEEQESLFGTRRVTHEDVVIELAWPVALAARSSLTPSERTATLMELCALIRAEHVAASRLPRGLPNDGKRASQLVSQLVGGGPEYWSSFDAEVLGHSLSLLEETATQPGYDEELTAVLRPALSLERQWTTQDGWSMTFSRHTLLPASEGWKNRARLVGKIRTLIAESTDQSRRLRLWKLLGEAHHSAMQALDALKGQDEASLLRTEVLNDLAWTHDVLRAGSPTTAELAAAREMWDWHRQYDKDVELKRAAEELEQLYRADQVAGEFEPLISFENVASFDEKGQAKAKSLAGSNDPSEIDRFIGRAIDSLGPTELRPPVPG